MGSKLKKILSSKDINGDGTTSSKVKGKKFSKSMADDAVRMAKVQRGWRGCKTAQEFVQLAELSPRETAVLIAGFADDIANMGFPAFIEIRATDYIDYIRYQLERNEQAHGIYWLHDSSSLLVSDLDRFVAVFSEVFRVAPTSSPSNLTQIRQRLLELLPESAPEPPVGTYFRSVAAFESHKRIPEVRAKLAGRLVLRRSGFY